MANNEEEADVRHSGGIKALIAQTNVIGNVIAAAASEKNSFEPLPFCNYSLFDDNNDMSQLKINVNPYASQKIIFLPKGPIKVSVTAERKHGAHIFHPYIYTLSFTHDKYKWETIRTYKEIKEVHKTLAKIVKADMGRSCSDISKENIKPDWPLFPTEHDHLISSSIIGERCKAIAEYLERLLTYPPFRDHPSVLQLLSVSPLSFVSEIGQSLIEGSLQKRTGDNVYYGHLSQLKICCEKVKLIYKKRWFILKDSYIVYLNEENNYSVGFVMLVDKAFECKMKHRAGAYHAIVIKNLQRSLVLKCKNSQQQKEWHDKILYMMQETGRHFYDNSLLRYDSFAPVRSNQLCKWYVNSSAYMEHVMDALNNAKEEIFITDWWMCPELYLKRPTDDLQYRLDKILLKKSKEGVKVYILLFKEVAFALSLLSSRAKNFLTQNGKNPNIKVLRHPEHSPAGVMMWSHHEKCVIIDQSIAFMGGIDLCFGRWDDDLHRLVDLGRKENITEIDTSKVEKPVIIDILNEIKETEMENELNKEINEIRNTLERTDTEKQFASTKLDQEEHEKPKSEAISELHSLQQKQHHQQEQSQQQESKADALIVAALMGNSITRFNRGRNKRITTQLSAPVNIMHSPVFSPDSASNSQVMDKHHITPATANKDYEKSKSMIESDNNANEVMSLKPDEYYLEDMTAKSDSKMENWNKSNISNKTNQNTLSNSRIGSSKASKYLSIPTEPHEADAADESKKEKVKKKWNQFKKNVKRKSHQNPLNRLKRRSSRSSSDDSGGEEDSFEEDNQANKYEEENVELPVISNEGYYWIGKDYSNTYKADFKDIADFSRDQFDRSEVPRMPWRDEGLVVFGEAARDLARHFIQRWNQCKREKVRQVESYPFLLPKSYMEPFNQTYTSWFKDSLYKCSVQMTRSLDNWSGGLYETESSILKAYRDLIRNAEHYIYIENQFFVTTCDSEKDNEVKNEIGHELVERIIKAHKNNQKFRIYIVLPLLPGFDSLNAIQAVQYYNLRSINLGEYSIFKTLKKAGITDPTEYITIHGMRNWSVLMGKLVQEIIYVHSKLMIVDDKYVICGSANVNDRSLLGKRDSEIAAVITDEEFQDSILSGQKVKSGKYALSLRKKIFKLHLGIYFSNPNKIDVTDCVSDEFYQLFKQTSNKNSQVYDEVFKCLPSDNIYNFEVLATYRDRPCLSKDDPVKGKAELEKNISGFIVDFPLKFLSQEKNFFPEINTPEGMVPTAMWT